MKDVLGAHIANTAIKGIVEEGKTLSGGGILMKLGIADNFDLLRVMIFINASELTPLRVFAFDFFSEFNLKHELSLIFNWSFYVLFIGFLLIFCVSGLGGRRNDAGILLNDKHVIFQQMVEISKLLHFFLMFADRF